MVYREHVASLVASKNWDRLCGSFPKPMSKSIDALVFQFSSFRIVFPVLLFNTLTKVVPTCKSGWNPKEHWTLNATQQYFPPEALYIILFNFWVCGWSPQVWKFRKRYRAVISCGAVYYKPQHKVVVQLQRLSLVEILKYSLLNTSHRAVLWSFINFEFLSWLTLTRSMFFL